MRPRHLDQFDVWAVLIIISGSLIRLTLILLGWPAPYNDEGTLGLMARHIAYQGAHPVLYYGQDYLGSLEAYLGAGFFHLFGPSTMVLRLSLILFFALFLSCMYLLTRLLYSRGLALFVIILLSLGAPEVVQRQLMAVGGTPELFFFTSLLLLLTAWLAFTATPSKQEYRGKKKLNKVGSLQLGGSLPLSYSRLIAYGMWGLIAGLDIWSHLLCLPFVISAGIVLVLSCCQELRPLTLMLLLVCLLGGMSPLLVYKVTVPVTNEQISLFSGVFGGGYHEPIYPSPVVSTQHPNMDATTAPYPGPPRPLLQVAGTLLVALPAATSGMSLCPLSSIDVWPLSDHDSEYTRLCTGIHGAWGVGYIVLWFVAAFTAIRFLIRYWWLLPAYRRTADLRQEAMCQMSRLMLLLGAGLILLAFVGSPQPSSVTPWTSSRYLVGLLIAIPAVLFPLWQAKNVVHLRRIWTKSLQIGSRFALLLLIFLACLLGTINIFQSQVHGAQSSYKRQQELIQHLLQLGATHIYTDYDDCNRIAFLSNEQIVCAVLDKGLKPGLDRYFPYRKIVQAWPSPFYVFPDGTAQQILLEQTAVEQHIAYQKFAINGYDAYKLEQQLITSGLANIPSPCYTASITMNTYSSIDGSGDLVQ